MLQLDTPCSDKWASGTAVLAAKNRPLLAVHSLGLHVEACVFIGRWWVIKETKSMLCSKMYHIWGWEYSSFVTHVAQYAWSPKFKFNPQHTHVLAQMHIRKQTSKNQVFNWVLETCHFKMCISVYVYTYLMQRMGQTYEYHSTHGDQRTTLGVCPQLPPCLRQSLSCSPLLWHLTM